MIDSRFYDIAGPFSLAELMSDLEVEPLLSGKISDQNIAKPAELSMATPGSISFISSAKNAVALDGSKATACFVSEKLASLVGQQHIIPIVSKTPRAHFARIVAKLVKPKTLDSAGGLPSVGKTAQIHATAIIGAGAVIGNYVKIGPYSVVGPGVVIGDSSVLESHVTLKCCVIGQNCLIKSGAQIGGEGFGMDRDENGVVELPHIGRAIVGDHVRIGGHSCIDRGFLGDTTIGDNVKIDNLVQIAHNCDIGAGTMIAGRTGISGSCKVGKNVLMGGAVGLADHITIGDGAQLAAQAGVMHNVPAGEIWSGIPAQPIRDHMRMISATRKLIKKKKT